MRIEPEHDIFNLQERCRMDFEWIQDRFSFCVAIEPRKIDHDLFQQKKQGGSLIEEVDGVVVCWCPEDMDDQQSVYDVITSLHGKMKNQSHAQQLNEKLRSQILLAQKVKIFLADIDVQDLSDAHQSIYRPLYQVITHTASLLPDHVANLSADDEKEVLTHLLGNENFYNIAAEKPENIENGHLTHGYKMRKIKQVLTIMSRTHRSSRDIVRSAADCTYDLFVEGSHLLGIIQKTLSDSVFHVGEDALFDQATLHDGTTIQQLVQRYNDRRLSATTAEKDDIMIDFMQRINETYENSETSGSPRQTLEKSEVQCVSRAHLGEMLRQIDGVKYSVVAMSGHAASLVQYDNQWHYMDIGRDVLYGLTDDEYDSIVKNHTLPPGVIGLYDGRARNNELYDRLKKDTQCHVFQRSLGSMLFNMGNRHGEQEKYDKKIQSYQKAIDAGCLQGYFNVGVAYYEQEEYEKAIQSYQKAIDVGDLEGYCNMGNVYDEQEEYKKAIQSYQKAIDCGRFQSYLNMGNVYHKQKEYERAIQAYEKFIKAYEQDDNYKPYVLSAQKKIDEISILQLK